MTTRACPPGGTFHTFDTPDGMTIRYAVWPNESDKGTFILLPGFREYIEKHFETIEDILTRGFAVVALDWRSQGLSTRPLSNRQKNYVRDFADYISDLDHLITTVVVPDLPGPYRLLAHSMGGHLALRYLHDHRYVVEGAILSSPMADIWLPTGLRLFSRLLIRLATTMGLSRLYGPGQGNYGKRQRTFPGNPLTSDEDRFNEDVSNIEDNPALKMGGATFGWLSAANRSIRQLLNGRYLKAISVPVYIVQAGDDQVVRNKAQELVVDNLLHGHLFLIENAKHELLRERDIIRNQFWQIFDRFVDR